MSLTRRNARGLVRACEDPQAFGLPLWPRQRDLLRAVEKGPRVHVWALGRRSGKTTMAAVVCLWDALMRPELAADVRPGERRYAVAVATNLRQARLIVSAARSIVERSPLLAGMIESANDDELVFRNGAAVTAFPCTSRGGRGWPVSCLVLDEFAHFVDTDGNSAAESVWRALTPSVAQFGSHGRIIVSSTPWGADGAFASLYGRAENGELPDAVAQHATTGEANPTIGADFLAAEEARDPDAFRSEYAAEFVGGGASFLDPERITECVVRDGELEPEEAVAWVAGLDPAFSSDPFGVVLVGRDRLDPLRLVVGYARAWKPSKRRPVSFGEQRDVQDAVLDQVAAVCLRFGARAVTDQHLAKPVIDYLTRRGVPVRAVPMNAVTKTEAYSELRARLNLGTVDLYEHADLLAELRRLRSRFTAGASAVVNPRVGGSHGDLAQALALAVYEHRHGIAIEQPSFGGERGLSEAFNADDYTGGGRIDGALHYGMKF